MFYAISVVYQPKKALTLNLMLELDKKYVCATFQQEIQQILPIYFIVN